MTTTIILCSINSHCLHYVHYLHNSRTPGLQFQDFPGFSRTYAFSRTFQGLEFWTIKFQDLPGLSRICTNPRYLPGYPNPDDCQQPECLNPDILPVQPEPRRWRSRCRWRAGCGWVLWRRYVLRESCERWSRWRASSSQTCWRWWWSAASVRETEAPPDHCRVPFCRCQCQTASRLKQSTHHNQIKHTIECFAENWSELMTNVWEVSGQTVIFGHSGLESCNTDKFKFNMTEYARCMTRHTRTGAAGNGISWNCHLACFLQ